MNVQSRVQFGTWGERMCRIRNNKTVIDESTIVSGMPSGTLEAMQYDTTD